MSEDAGMVDAEVVGSICSPCTSAGDCNDGLRCAAAATGVMACLQPCDMDGPGCPTGFECVASLGDVSLPEPLCAPTGERCCLDGDGDLHGQGMDCLGTDCDDSDETINSSAMEICDGDDDDCDGVVDEGDAAAECPPADRVVRSECSEIGVCETTECEPGFSDCDGDASNGCETATNTQLHCGNCFASCEPAHATGDCSTGSCEIESCDDGFGDCDDDPSNGCETPLDKNSDCGGCGIACSPPFAVGDCSSGTCEIGSCNPHQGDCDGDVANGCETSTTSNADCGACGVTCAPLNAVGDCSTGSCRIMSCSRSTFDDCDMDPSTGCETSLRTLTDCGVCGSTCSLDGGSSSCASGTCELTGCEMGLADCDGVSGCEQPTNTLTHCSDCDTPCDPANGVGDCSSGTCIVVSCDDGWTDCDGNAVNGCETPLDTVSDCGSCGSTCELANATASCSADTCVIDACDGEWANCDGEHSNGCEQSLETLTDCGACGAVCSRPNATASCSSGSCRFVSCSDGFTNCDGDRSNGCEISHAETRGAAGGGPDAGSYDGDVKCNLFSCSDNTGWDNFAVFTYRDDGWFRAQIDEDSACTADLEHRVRLRVPPGIDYDLEVGSPRITTRRSTNRGAGVDESVTVGPLPDNDFVDDSYEYFVHVVYVSGHACVPYTLYFDGHDC